MSITGTLIVQMIVFAILVWFTMKFVWPPITAALDERAKKIQEGLSAADKAKSEQESVKAREALREQVALLAVKGAESILKREVNASVHAELLNRLKTEL